MSSACPTVCFAPSNLYEQELSGSVRDASRSGWLGLKIGLSFLLLGQSTIFGLALNLHDDIPPGVRHVVETALLAGSLLALAFFGIPLARSVVAGIRECRITIEMSFILSVIGAFAISMRAYLAGSGSVYFEVITILLVIHALGKQVCTECYIFAISKSRPWLEGIATCRIVGRDQVARKASVSEARAGDLIEVWPGEAIPVDGIIESGSSYINEGVLSGEPYCTARAPGDRVRAGTMSVDGLLRIEATSIGSNHSITRLLALIESARRTPSRLQTRIDQLAAWFVPTVVLAAVVTFFYWSVVAKGETSLALYNSMAVLLIACPCAIGIATPLAYWVAIGRMAERGLIVKSADTIASLAQCDYVCFDKTGTLSNDRMRLVDLHVLAEGTRREQILDWISLVESSCRHPIARCLSGALGQRAVKDRLASLRVHPGLGVSGEVVDESGAIHIMRIGRDGWAADPLAAGPSRDVDSDSTIYISIDEQLVAFAMLREQFRDSMKEALAGLREIGMPIEILTGDREENARPLEVAFRANQTPEDKQLRLLELKSSGRKVAMVGDGINDAPAIAEAHVGIVLSSGAALAQDAASAILHRGDLCAIPWAIRLSRAVVYTVQRNLIAALVYNAIGMALAASGMLHPIAAVVLMMLSSLGLIVSSCVAHAEHRSCADPGYRPPTPYLALRTWLHGAALGMQSLLILALVPESQGPLIASIVIIGLAALGVTAARIWHGWETIPHYLDMCYGMFTLGNLGMLLGWWFDRGFAPLESRHCDACASMPGQMSLMSGMNLGMLLFSNLGMVFLGRRSAPGRGHVAAMLVGGNIGMLAGMALGGQCAARIDTSFAASFLGMSFGMMAGMLMGTAFISGFLSSIEWLRRLSRSSRSAIA